MTKETRTITTRRCQHQRRLSFLALALVFGACSDAGDSGANGTPATQTADSMVVEPAEPLPANRGMPRPRGDTVSIAATLAEYSIDVEPDTIDAGSISLLLQNNGERTHTIEVRGDTGGRWVSLPIRPGSGVIMTMRIESGHYALTSTDPAYTDRGMRGAFHVR